MSKVRVFVQPGLYRLVDAPAGTPSARGMCRDLGPSLAGEPCGSVARRCLYDGAVCSAFTPCDKADRWCQTCEFHSDIRTSTSLPMAFEPRPTDVPAGVVIGSYGWPSLVEIQIRLIRQTCGPVPILVSDDKPDSPESTAIARICTNHPDVFHWPNVERIGHTGGDISAFFKGIVWGSSRGLKAVAKLSQRFMISKPRWLQDGVSDLLASGLPIATRTCRGSAMFDLRTEAAILDVGQWHRSEVLSRIRPRRYWTDNPAGISAETVMHRVLVDLLGGMYWPWSLFGTERKEQSPGVVWHNSHTESDYKQLAGRVGVRLDPGFHVRGWEQELATGTYHYG